MITDQRKQICWKSTFIYFTEIICSQLESDCYCLEAGCHSPRDRVVTSCSCTECHNGCLVIAWDFADLNVNVFLFVTVPLTISPCTWVSLHHAPWALAYITEYLNRGAHGVESNPGKFPFFIYIFYYKLLKNFSIVHCQYKIFLCGTLNLAFIVKKNL